jgi:hypothetical protein
MSNTPDSATPRKPNPQIVTPKSFEQMTEPEVEEIMEERRRKEERPEWGHNEFGEPRPLSAWDQF